MVPWLPKCGPWSRRPTVCIGRCGEGVYDRRVETPFWLDEPAELLPVVRLEGPVEVAIVGGGVTGCSCALTLAEAGMRVRLYEARAIASGASGRNGGLPSVAAPCTTTPLDRGSGLNVQPRSGA